jgi:hypothetical protein
VDFSLPVFKLKLVRISSINFSRSREVPGQILHHGFGQVDSLGPHRGNGKINNSEMNGEFNFILTP